MYIDLPGVRLWTVDSGAGTPIVLLHANTGTSLAWENQISTFSSAGYRAIAFDRRSWGKSMADPATGPQPGTIAGDLEALAGHLALDSFHLVGIAGGGFAALDYAAWSPGGFAASWLQRVRGSWWTTRSGSSPRASRFQD